MTPPSMNQVGRLEILCVVAVLCLLVGSFWDLWPFNLLIALLLLAVMYGVLCDLRSFNRATKPVTAGHSSRKAHAHQTDGASR